MADPWAPALEERAPARLRISDGGHTIGDDHEGMFYRREPWFNEVGWPGARIGAEIRGSREWRLAAFFESWRLFISVLPSAALVNFKIADSPPILHRVQVVLAVALRGAEFGSNIRCAALHCV